jgi:hypothetical protein
MLQSVQDIMNAIPTAKGFLIAPNRKLSLAEERNWNMTASDLFNQMIRVWIADHPLPTELQPIKG